MFIYEKKLQYPVKIANCNPKLASPIPNWRPSSSVSTAGRTASWAPPCVI